MGRSHSDDFVGRVLDFGPGRLLLLAQRQVTLMFSFADVKGEYREKKGKEVQGTRGNSKFQTANSKSRVTIHSTMQIQLDTIQIHDTIQNTMYYSNSEYEQCKSTHRGVDQAPKLSTIQGTTMLIWWVEH